MENNVHQCPAISWNLCNKLNSREIERILIQNLIQKKKKNCIVHKLVR